MKDLATAFREDFGRPSKDLYVALGALILQQLHDLTDQLVVEAVALDIAWHYALDIRHEPDAYMCERTLRIATVTTKSNASATDASSSPSMEALSVSRSRTTLFQITSDLVRFGVLVFSAIAPRLRGGPVGQSGRTPGSPVI